MIERGVPVLIKQHRIVNLDDVRTYLQGKRDGWQLLTIKRPPDDISLQQHRFYRGMVVPFVKDLIFESHGRAYTNDQIHALLKELHGVRETIGKTECLKSMADYSKEGVQEYFENIRRWVWDVWEEVLPDSE